MPKRVTRDWLSRVVWGLTSGALALSLLSTGGSSAPTTGARLALAEDIDCYNDKDLYNLPECVERRALDKKSGNQQNDAQGAPPSGPESGSGGSQQQQSGGGDQQASGGNQPQSGGPQQ